MIWKSKSLKIDSLGTFFGGSKYFSRGMRKDFVLCNIDILKPPMQNPWKGYKFHIIEQLLNKDHFVGLYTSAQLFRGRSSTFEIST